MLRGHFGLVTRADLRADLANLERRLVLWASRCCADCRGGRGERVGAATWLTGFPPKHLFTEQRSHGRGDNPMMQAEERNDITPTVPALRAARGPSSGPSRDSSASATSTSARYARRSSASRTARASGWGRSPWEPGWRDPRHPGSRRPPPQLASEGRQSIRTRSNSSQADMSDSTTWSPGCNPSTTSIVLAELLPRSTRVRVAPFPSPSSRKRLTSLSS